MINHPNRSKKNPNRNPKPMDIVNVRTKAGLTQKSAANLLFVTESAYKKWEIGIRQMPVGYWKLFQLRLGIIKLEDLSTPDAPPSE